MASIEKRSGKNGVTYQVKIRVKGHPQVTETFKRKTDASKWAQKTEADIRQGIFFPKSNILTKTFDDALERYDQQVIDKHFPPKEAHIVRYLLKFWKKELGKKFLREITPSLLIECRDKLANHKSVRGETYSASTVNRYLIAASHIFKVAMNEWEWMTDNPMKNVPKMKKNKGRDRYLSEDEKNRLLQVCKEDDSPYLYIVILIALTTGARRNEILELEWRDIDFNRNRITYRDTKNGDTRTAPMMESVKAELLKLREVPRLNVPFVFARKDGKKPMEMKKHWERAFKTAELEDFRFHDLRHTAASYLAMSGASLLDIAQILGHRTMDMVKRYAHLTENHTEQVIKRMTAQFMD